MIKRSYFALFRKNFDDGSGKYSENSFTIDVKSWTPKAADALKAAQLSANAKLSEYPGDNAFCVAFNRL